MTTATEPSEALSAPQPLSDATWSGDLGTLLPFLVGLIVVAGVQPSSILLAFGLSLVIVGLRFGVPMPVQPMKAVGAAALGHTVVVTNDMQAVLALTALITGAFWLITAWSGLARWLAWHVSRDVIHGVVLGLCIALIVAGLRRIESDAVLGGQSVMLALVLLGRGRWLTMPVLMAIGLAVGWWRQPGLMQLVTETPWTGALPAPPWTVFNQPGVWLTAIGLATAQIPLTFGNVILGILAETRRPFTTVNVDESRMAHSTGFMNLLAGGLGAPPMCFGAGGIDAVRRVQLSLGDIARLAATSLGATVYLVTK